MIVVYPNPPEVTHRWLVSIALDQQKWVLYVLTQGLRQIANPTLTLVKLTQTVPPVVEAEAEEEYALLAKQNRVLHL